MGGKTSAASHNKYIAKAYDRVNLTMPKGRKEVVQAHAEARNESVNGFINRAITETMEREEGEINHTTETSRLILELRAAGWSEKEINDLILCIAIEFENEQYKPKARPKE